jgi:hypothetical protein
VPSLRALRFRPLGVYYSLPPLSAQLR